MLLLACMTGLHSLFAQIEPAGGGAAHFEHTECLSDEERAMVLSQVEENVLELQQRGILQQEPGENIVYFNWPLKLQAGITDPSYYGISNFVDQNGGSGLLDYNCGNRTYDGHKGTDIFLWPFPWMKMDNNEVEVIAAEAGIIVAKYDGNFDRQCSWINGAQGNAIILQHADGSRSWYWHLKKQSLTSKGIGASVASGEFIGIVGSSGISSGPHLHFEIYNTSNQLIDPWSGSCNGLNTQSWWSGQKPYRDPKINRLATHAAAPNMPNCPPEALNLSTQFQQGHTIYFGAYYQDQQNGAVSNYAIHRPDGTTWQSWNHSSPDNYNASWWYWYFTLPSNAPVGTWSFRVTFNNQTTVHPFTVQGSGTSSVLNVANVNQQLQLYPVPASDWVEVALPAPISVSTADILVFDMWGNVALQLLSVPVAESGLYTRVPLDVVPAGAYALHVRTGGDVYSTRFIKL
jgi:murein DD-endopeptidase MepM/ murein hydrolase activator NlpD